MQNKILAQNKRGGFTLVEAVVAAVIAAVIGLTAVMVYQGFVREARQETVQGIADAAAAAANAYTRKTGANLAAGDSARLGLYFTDPSRFTVTITPGTDLNGSVSITDVDLGITATASY